ncbi:TlpA family protein disulfide reductase [Ancylomarina euxinus]|uniref:TlpA family protein disulfide reductase n=1 Tax=Ancylomarina euxinus TaxID=2283627 RepID=A0A425XXT8_9BACT|nr:TlpA disulfide reductase family protein [Ancylomarina euxinus]MCZ4696035.1 TlpA disulfide reductase family protein [Ancylomarina euxinus]MUP13974.1 redoxin domain-containing protein [Ancylomarina euxinus]RRG19528.1 TlpA family protein disulfide reductase [Ancylomarina euxinus]
MKYLIIILLLTLTTGVYAQTEYYTTDGKNRLLQADLDKISTNLKTKYSEVLDKEMFVNIKIKETERKGDSIIHKISFDITDKKTTDKFKNSLLADLKGKEFLKFNLSSINGEMIRSESLKGKPTLINFWFKGCAPCIDEMPILNQIFETYKSEYNFISITYETKKDVNLFLKKHAFEFKHLVNARAFIDELGIQSYPLNLFIDSKGILRFVEGGIPYEDDEKGGMQMGNGHQFIKLLKSLD